MSYSLDPKAVSRPLPASKRSSLGPAYPAPVTVPGVTGQTTTGYYTGQTASAGYDAGKYYSSGAGPSSTYYQSPSAATGSKPTVLPSYWSQVGGVLVFLKIFNCT